MNFTFQAANEAVEDVIRITEETLARLADLEATWGKLPFRKYDALRGVDTEDLIRAEWAQEIAGLGIMPKGFFVVDFQSPDPNTYYCWSYPEQAIEHEHKVWETFADRRLIVDADEFDHPVDSSSLPPPGFWPDNYRDDKA